jgi:hypothetical protein
MKRSISFVLMCTEMQVSPALRDCMPNYVNNSPKTVQELEQLYQKCPVVGTTCLGIGQ